MKSNRLFYIGLGCLISTLCWTVVMIAREERNLSHLEVDRLICNELQVLDKDGKVGIHMYDRPYGDGGGSDLYMIFKDNRILSDGTPSQVKLWLSPGGLRVDNWKGRSVAGIGLAREGADGSLWLTYRDESRRHNEFDIDTANAKYSKTHCPCQRIE